MSAGSCFLNRNCPAGKNCPLQYTPISSSIIDTTAAPILDLVKEAEIASHDFNGNVRVSLFYRLAHNWRGERGEGASSRVLRTRTFSYPAWYHRNWMSTLTRRARSHWNDVETHDAGWDANELTPVSILNIDTRILSASRARSRLKLSASSRDNEHENGSLSLPRSAMNRRTCSVMVCADYRLRDTFSSYNTRLPVSRGEPSAFDVTVRPYFLCLFREIVTRRYNLHFRLRWNGTLQDS